MADYDKKVSLIEIEVDTESAIKEVNSLTLAIADQQNKVKNTTKEIKNLEKTNEELGKEVKKGTISQEEASKSIKKNEDEIKRLTISSAKEKDQLKTLNAERRQAVKVSETQSNSLQALRNQSAKLKKQLNNQETATESGRKKFKSLSDELEQTNGKIRKLDKGAGDFKTNIGNYPESLNAVSGGLGGMVRGFMAATKAALAFIATPIGMILAGVALAIAAVRQAFVSSEEGQNKFAKIMAVIGTVVGNLTDLLSDLGESIISAFENPKKAWSNFVDSLKAGYEFLKGQIIDRFKANFTILAGRVESDILKMRIAWNDFTGDSEEAEELRGKLKKVKEDVVEAQRVIKEKNQEIVNGYNAAIGKVKEFIKENEREAKIAAEIADSRATADKMERNLIISRAKLESKIAELRLKSKEKEKFTDEERKEFLISAEKLTEKLYDQEVRVAKIRAVALSKENTLSKSNKDAKKAEAEAIANVIQMEKRRADALRTITSERAALEKRIKAELEKKQKEEEAAEKKRKLEEEKLAADKIEAQKNLNSKIDELNKARVDRAYAFRLREAKNESEINAILQEQAELQHKEKMQRLEEEEEELAEQKFEIEEERQIRQAEIDLAKEEQLAQHEANLANIQENWQKIRLDKIKKFEQDSANAIRYGQQVANSIISIASSITERRYRKKYANLEKQLNTGQITEEEYAKKKERLEQKQALAEWRIAKVADKVAKVAAVAQITASTGAAVLKSIQASPLTFGQPWAGFAIGAGALNIGATLAKPAPPKPSFAQGGDVFGAQVNGRSHALGGESIYVGGKYFGEMQGGEGLFVTKREATNPALQLLNKANLSEGGASMFSQSSRFLQDGGSVDMSGGGISAADLASALSEMPNPVVDVRSIMAGINAENNAKEVGTI